MEINQKDIIKKLQEMSEDLVRVKMEQLKVEYQEDFEKLRVQYANKIEEEMYIIQQQILEKAVRFIYSQINENGELKIDVNLILKEIVVKL